ncbi:hypothetical protein, partial [Nitrospirillum viridazoti]|uniref:hypothetical protein n=1 Tax=Nitrospirillum viridazoti TaxID=3144925 RepID=UPI0019D6B657
MYRGTKFERGGRALFRVRVRGWPADRAGDGFRPPAVTGMGYGMSGLGKRFLGLGACALAAGLPALA